MSRSHSTRSHATPAPQRPADPPPTAGVIGWTLVPLRAFLGFTFCFAGLQKLANPGFFRASDPASIQSQLAGAARSSPIHVFVSPLTHVAVPLGVIIAFAELAIGIGTLLGLWQRAAAAGGILLSFMLFLTVSYHASPYYTGADIVFVFGWTPLLLAGAGPMLSLDTSLAARAATADQTQRQAGQYRQQRQAGQYRQQRQAPRAQQPETELSRKSVITTLAAVGGLVLGGLAAGIGRLAGRSSSGNGAARQLGPTAQSSGSGSGSGSGSNSQQPSGQLIGPASDVPVGGAASFSDPKTGNPSIVLRPSKTTFLAFNAVCPHAGCTVGYQQSAKLLVCPCHGSQFNAATGAVEMGPAPTGLTRISITENGGQLYAD